MGWFYYSFKSIQAKYDLTGQLSGFTDEMLSTLFAVKAELCNKKFELKVNDVRFVGHPTLLPYRANKDDTAAMILINIVFALQASASHSIGKYGLRFFNANNWMKLVSHNYGK